MHGVAIIEEGRYSASAVRQKPMKSTIQAFWERGIVFIEMHQIRRSFALELMASVLQARSDCRFRIFFAGKHEGDVTLVFSGEEYPEPAVRPSLKNRGHEFKREGPSYLVHLYEDDPSFPKCLNGRFHGLLADRTRGVATLFNDRYSMHRLYYHEAKEAFYFAVEAKAILAVRPELRRTDPQSLGEFVACGCVLENRTFFEGVHVLPAGSAWTFRAGATWTKKTYFEPREWEQQDLLDPESYHREIREIFSRRFPRRSEE